MQELLIFTAIGFIAQLIDGALGMGYGIIAMTTLLTMGVPPLVANTAVQASKLVATAVSSTAHWFYKNVDERLTQQLVGTGILGGIVGAVMVTSIPTTILTPLLAIYLFGMSVQIWLRLRHKQASPEVLSRRSVLTLGGIGGFLSALGGTGWGPVVTSTLLARGQNARISIGSVNIAEFFVTMSILGVLGPQVAFDSLSWQIVVGLILGGVCAAPLAASLCGKLPNRSLTQLVGALIMILSIMIIVNLL